MPMPRFPNDPNFPCPDDQIFDLRKQTQRISKTVVAINFIIAIKK